VRVLMPVSIRFEQVLQGLRALATQNWRRLKVELQTYAALRGRSSVRLADFLHDQPLELKDIYRSGTGQGRSGWTALKRDAGLIIAEPRPEEDYFSRRFGDLPHVDDPRRLDLMAAIGANQAQAEVLDAQRVLGLQMLAYLIDGRHEQAAGHQTFAERLKWVNGTSIIPGIGWRWQRPINACPCLPPVLVCRPRIVRSRTRWASKCRTSPCRSAPCARPQCSDARCVPEGPVAHEVRPCTPHKPLEERAARATAAIGCTVHSG